MATKVYETTTISLVDGTELHLTPLKIKFLREFMELFQLVKQAENDYEAIALLSDCARVAMKQYYPSIKTIEDLEDNIDLPTVYKILDAAAGIRVDKDKTEETVKKQATKSGSSWDELDLAEIEAEVFLLGIWKDYNELEISMSMPEILATLGAKRDLDYQEKKFLAAMQGVDLDKQSGNQQNAWEEMKARVFSGGGTNDPNDVLALQGQNAAKAGFGIGMGLDYKKL
jgi:hypothetical protein